MSLAGPSTLYSALPAFICVIFLRHSFELSLLGQAMFTERTMCQVQGIKICYIVSELQVFTF